MLLLKKLLANLDVQWDGKLAIAAVAQQYFRSKSYKSVAKFYDIVVCMRNLYYRDIRIVLITFSGLLTSCFLFPMAG